MKTIGTPVCILTDHGKPEKFRGCRFVVTPALQGPFWSLPGVSVLRAAIRGLIAWLRIVRFRRPAVVVTYGGRTGFVIAACQALWRPFIQPRIHVMFDFLLDPPKKGVGGLIDKLKAKVFNSAVDRAVVWGKKDVPLFSNSHGLDLRRLRFHPYHITLDDLGKFELEESDEGFVFCGGNVGRDFQLFIDAIGPLGYPAVVATQVSDVPAMATKWPQIKVCSVTPIEFRQLMAKSKFVVEVHPTSFFRSAGHQTMLNAMYLGKPVILSDVRSAEGYVRQGRNGLVTESGDQQALANAIRTLWEDPALCDRLTERGRIKTRRPIYRTECHMQSVYNVAIRLHQKQTGASYSEAQLKIY